MSAPIEAYHTEEFHTTDTVVVNSYPIAKFTDNVAVLKSRFYLDWLLRIADGTDNEWGFIGGCTVGSDNYNMHTRGVMTFKGGNEVYYNDAGLNTLGFVEDLTISQQDVNIEKFIIKPINSNSAYYIDGSLGLEISVNNGAYFDYPIQNMLKNTSVSINDFNIASLVQFQDTVRVKAYHDNTEGRYVTNELTIVVQAAPITMKYDDTFASWANAKPTGNQYFYTVRGILMSTIYLDAMGNTQAGEGYFVYDGYWYKHEYSPFEGKRIITDFGRAEPGHYPDGDPANPTTGYTEFNWYAYHATSQSGACSSVYAPVTTYRRNSDGMHFMDTSLTTPAPDGYYIEDALTKGWFLMQSQLIINSGSC